MPSKLSSSLRSVVSSGSRSLLRRKDKNGDEQSTSTQSTSHMTGFSTEAGRRPRPSFPKNVSRRGRFSKQAQPSSTRKVNKKSVESLWDTHSGKPLGSSCHSRTSSSKRVPANASTCSRRRSHNSRKPVIPLEEPKPTKVPPANPASVPEKPAVRRPTRRNHPMRMSDLTEHPAEPQPVPVPVEQEPQEPQEEQEEEAFPEHLHASELGVCADENGLPSFLDMIIEVPMSDLPMVIEIPACGQTEDDCDSDDDEDEDDGKHTSRVWDVVSMADVASVAASLDKSSHVTSVAASPVGNDSDDDDDDDDSFAQAGENEEIHNKVRNLATLLRRQSAIRASAAAKSERRIS